MDLTGIIFVVLLMLIPTFWCLGKLEDRIKELEKRVTQLQQGDK